MEAMICDRFSVVQDDYELKNWQTASELLTKIVGLPPAPARLKARKTRGFLATDLPAEVAQRLRDACVERGIEVELVPQNEIIPMIKPVRMHQVWITEDALCVRAGSWDAMVPLGWETVRLVALAKMTRTDSFQHWEMAGDLDAVNLKVTPYVEESAEYLADVFAFQPDGSVLGARLISRELNYSEALGNLAPDILNDANARLEGFRLLLSAIVARAVHAYVPSNSAALLAKLLSRAAKTFPRAKMNEFDAMNRWHLQRLRMKGPPVPMVG
jgi:hypothetical protein